MQELRFSWDPHKAQANERKHGISFEEASTVFLDDNALLQTDPEHSEEEDRFLLLGLSARVRVLVVCHCFWEAKGIIRLISARRATKPEKRQYLERCRQ